MNRLEEKYKDRIVFRYVDAGTRDGQAELRELQLLGHPAFALIDPDGDVLWTGLGEQPVENIENQLSAITIRQ